MPAMIEEFHRRSLSNELYVWLGGVVVRASDYSDRGGLAVVAFYELFSVFFPRDAMHSAVLVIVNLSVRLSVYHTRGLCQHGSKYVHNFFISSAP